MWDVRWEDGYKGMTFGRLLGDSYILQSVFLISKIHGMTRHGSASFPKPKDVPLMVLALVCR